MTDDLEEKSKEPIDWQYYRGLVRRHLWHFLIPFFGGWVAVWAGSWFMPSVYRSGTLILVEEPTVPQEFVVSNVAGDLQGRLQSITQQILSRTRLLRIIEQLSLYTDYRQHSSPDDLVERMRGDIQIDLNRSGDGRELTSFNIYYSARNPNTARAVTSELCNLFINENLEARQQQSKATTDFLENQLEAARRDLAMQEQKVKDYKDKHLGELPGQLQTNLQVLAGLQSQLQNEQDALTRARQQNAYLQSLLSQYRALQNSTKVGENAPASLPAIDHELERLKSELHDLQAHYTEKHPDVRKVKKQIAQAERLKTALQQTVSSPTEQKEQPNTAADLGEKSPTFQLESQLTANNYEIANHQSTIKELQGRLGQYQARLNQEPVLEQQLADITRGYDQSKADYDSLLKKKNESELATNLEFQQKGEHFRVLDPPNLPAKPYSPQRTKLFGMGFVIGIVLGAAFSAATEFMDDHVFSEQELKKLLPFSVIAEIPPVLSTEQQKHERRLNTLRWIATGMVVITLVLAFGFTYIHG
jgi:succinoglycan biosynthesis transport protein ExoP